MGPSLKFRHLLVVALAGTLVGVVSPAQSAVRTDASRGTLEAADAPVELIYSDGRSTGLSAAMPGDEPQPYLIAGSRHAGDVSVAPGTTLDLAGTGAGEGVYASVPEPRNWLMLLAGIGLVAVMVERVKRRRI